MPRRHWRIDTLRNKFLPESAIDLIDDAGARIRVRMTAAPDVAEFNERIAEVRRQKETSIDAQDFEKAQELRDQEKRLIAERMQREQEWRGSGHLDVVAEVDDREIEEVLVDLGLDGIRRVGPKDFELHYRPPLSRTRRKRPSDATRCSATSRCAPSARQRRNARKDSRQEYRRLTSPR